MLPRRKHQAVAVVRHESVNLSLTVLEVHESHVRLGVMSDDLDNATVDIDLIGQQSSVTTGLFWDEWVRDRAEEPITDRVFRFPSDLNWLISTGFIYRRCDDFFFGFALTTSKTLEIQVGSTVVLEFKYDEAIKEPRVV
jgi:hypothetical protein